MNEKIKEIKRKLLCHNEDGDYNDGEYVLEHAHLLIAEIERLEKENDKLHQDIGIYSNDMFQERKKSRELQCVCGCAKELMSHYNQDFANLQNALKAMEEK